VTPNPRPGSSSTGAQRIIVALVVTSDAFVVDLARALPRETVTFGIAASVDEALVLSTNTRYSVLVLDTDSLDAAAIGALRQAAPKAGIVATGANASFDHVVRTIRSGAQEFLEKGTYEATVLHRTMLSALDRKAREDVLEQRTRTLDAAFEALSPALAVIDPRGTLSLANRAWHATLEDAGSSLAQVTAGQSLLAALERDALREPSAKETLQGIQLVLAGTLSSFQSEFARSTEDGERWFAMSVERMTGSTGGAVLSCVDISDRKRVEHAQKLSEREFRELLERFPEAVAIHRGGRFVWVNHTMLEYLGYRDPGELVGRPITCVLHPDEVAATLDRVRDLTGSGAPQSPRETRVLRADGSVGVSEIQAIPVHFEGKAAVLAIGRDVTQHRELVARMMQADRMQSVGLLAAALGHEINNPLSFVTANVDVALRAAVELEKTLDRLPAHRIDPELLDTAFKLGSGAREIREALGDARQGSRRVQSVVSDLRSFSRPENLEDGPVRLEPVLDAAVNMVWNEIRHRAKLVKDYADVPSVLGNEARLGQVFLNLLTNAAHSIAVGAADRNEIRLRVYPTADRVVVEIADTGSGIDPTHLSRIFDPFFTTKPPGQGTGLGLPICRDIVRGLGGDLEVDSELGRGSTFRVLLRTSVEAPLRASTAAPLTPPRTALRVLVVDDEPLIGRVVGRCLGKGRLVEWVSSGHEALRRLRGDEKFDVVLLDVMMPEMTGIEVYETLRETAPDDLRRVVFLTGGAFTPLAREFLERVPNRRLSKPFEAVQLRSVVDEVAAELP